MENEMKECPQCYKTKQRTDEEYKALVKAVEKAVKKRSKHMPSQREMSGDFPCGERHFEIRICPR